MEASYEVPRVHPFGRDTMDLPRWKYDTRTRVTIPITN